MPGPMSATPAAKRAVAESCIDYLTLELVNNYRRQLQGPPLQVSAAHRRRRRRCRSLLAVQYAWLPWLPRLSPLRPFV